jgi:hypothetical protein
VVAADHVLGNHFQQVGGAVSVLVVVDRSGPGAVAFIGPAPTGIIGMIPFILVAIPMVIQLQKAEKGTA